MWLAFSQWVRGRPLVRSCITLDCPIWLRTLEGSGLGQGPRSHQVSRVVRFASLLNVPTLVLFEKKGVLVGGKLWQPSTKEGALMCFPGSGLIYSFAD